MIFPRCIYFILQKAQDLCAMSCKKAPGCINPCFEVQVHCEFICCFEDKELSHAKHYKSLGAFLLQFLVNDLEFYLKVECSNIFHSKNFSDILHDEDQDISFT